MLISQVIDLFINIRVEGKVNKRSLKDDDAIESYATLFFLFITFLRFILLFPDYTHIHI